ncbi:MAG TPA: hypothetical protein PLM55_10595 [Chitinophagales bacterium]|nr:hypothetical protein [Chitinophagales bacterium]
MLSATFENENKNFEQRKKITSVLFTVLVHGLLLLVLYFSTLSLPNPPYQENEGGMSVNYGTSDVGTGNEQAFTYTPVETPPQTAPNEATPQAAPEVEDIATQDIEDAPVIAKTEKAKQPTVTKPVETPTKPTKPTTNTTPPTPPQPKADENALFKPGAYGKPNNSTGDGTGGGKGDQGELGGDPNSKSYEGSGKGYGTGNGDGIGDGNVRLSGRQLRFKPQVNDRSQATGKVVIQIKVDRTGKVVEARYTQAGSTTADEGLIRTSIEAAYKYRFDENLNAAEVQNGAISFIYKVH